MPNHQRARYAELLAAVAVLQREVTRAEQLLQVAINRWRQAEDEGFADEAHRRERLIDAMTDDLERVRQRHLAALAAAEEQRLLAVEEEIDEALAASDAVVLVVLTTTEALLERLVEAMVAVERVTTLADGLPTTARQPRRKAAAARAQIATLRRLTEALQQAAAAVDRTPPA